MKIKSIFASLFLLTSLIAVPHVFAGGGILEPASIQGPNDSSFANPGEAFTVTFRAHLDSVTYPVSADLCKQCPIKVEFFDPRDGDIVNPTSDKTNDEGEITAKFASLAPYIRYIRATVTLPNGTVYKGSPLMLNFTGKNLVYPETDNPIYALPTLTPFPDSNKVNINKEDKVSQIPTQNPNSTVVYVNNGNDQKVNDLNKKVNALQSQLEQSQKKQSFLEQRINDLITLIKKLFPFFK